MQSRFPLLLGLAAIVVAAACDSSTTGPVDQGIPTGTALKMSLTHDSLFFGKTVSFAISDSADTLQTPIEHEWTSSDTTVAVVDANGTVLGVGAGTVRITVQRAGARDTFKLRVVVRRADGGAELVAGAEGGAMNGPLHCAIGANGGMYCRSRTQSDSLRVFERMPGSAGVSFVSASTSLWGQCGLSTIGEIMCWGPNSHGFYARTGTVTTDTGANKVSTSLQFVTMQHGGHSQTCGISTTDSLVYCWGHNDGGQLARTTTPSGSDDPVPAPVVGMGKAIAVATENFSTCALDLEGAAFCTPKPVAWKVERVPGNHSFKHIVNGDDFSCAIDQQGSAWCWGFGPLGDGLAPSTIRNVPARVTGDLKFRKLSAAFRKFACGISTDDDLYCWGDFAPAAVSNRLESKRFSPVQLLKGIKFRDVTGNLCGITTDGRALCW